MPALPRAYCPVCGFYRPVRRNGVMREHRAHRGDTNWCAGSGRAADSDREER